MDDIQISVIQQSVDVTLQEQVIEATFPGAGTVHSHRMGQIVSDPFMEATFSNPLNLNVAEFKSYRCIITGNTVVNLINAINGDDGMITLIIDGTGAYLVTLGTMFTIQLGVNTINTFANKTNVISWRKMFDDIIYTVAIA